MVGGSGRGAGVAGPCRVWVAPCPLHPPSLVPPQRHQGLVQPLPSEAPVWEPPQHGELRQQAAQVRGVPGGRSSPGSPPPFEEVPVSPWGSRSQLSLPSPHPRLHEDWESLVRELRAQLESIYFPDTVEEWMEENVNPYLDQLRDLVRDYRAIIRLNARPKAS